jgi:hypothetical protein
MRRLFRYFALFVTIAIIIGVISWLRTGEDNWWATVDLPQGELKKFKLSMPEQLLFSFAIGSLLSAPVVALVFAIQTLRYRRKSRSASPIAT